MLHACARYMATTTRACLVALVVAYLIAFFFLEASAASPTATAGRLRRRRAPTRISLLRRLNKPPIASIQSHDGDIIDCVHISKQPAFDHPLLKNHSIQMRPSYHPGGGLHDDTNNAPNPISQTWHQNGKCPENTIPIRRTKEEDVLRASSISRFGKKRPKSIPKPISTTEPEAIVTTGHQHAAASSMGDEYYGTKMTISVWQPTIQTAQDFSLAQLWIIAGSYSNNDLNTIEAGWQVFPAMYGDNNTRLFIYWTRDAYQKIGCYNLLCSGFVQTNNQIVLGASISPDSLYDGSQYDFDILIWKDPARGNWWLQVGGHDVGYWPSSIFTYLADNASTVEWGGEVYSPVAGQTSTQMGSGHFPKEGFGKASYIKNIQVVDSSNVLISPSGGVGVIVEQPNCYNVQSGTNITNWGTYIFYGGPGKNPNCP